MAESFFLKCMGYPELRRPDGRPVRVKVRKHLAVLLYLAVEGRHRCSREVLVDLLWGSAPPHDGRHSLSTALSFLRAILGKDAIEGTPTTVKFERNVVTLDLDRLRDGAGSGNGDDAAFADDSFLADFSIPDSPAFMHWRDGHQARLLPVIQRALLYRIDEARRTSDVQSLITYGDRLLALDPLSEEGTRARVEAHALSGNRLAALRMFEEWKGMLQAELGARPSEIMEGLALRLRKNGVERAVSPMVTLKNEKWVDRAFIGRAQEFQVLFEAWEATTQLQIRHVMLEGESGIGKSTLAQRFVTAIQLEGAACARVQCFELEQRIPFGMIGTLVTSLLDRPGAAGTDPAALAELGRLVPKVRERFTRLPPPRSVEGEAARVLFAEGFFAMLESLTEEQPVALIVDDYPRSDEASLSVLHMLLRRPGLDKVMVVLTARPAEPGEPAQAQRIRRGVASLGLQQLHLEPLAEGDSNALLDALVSPTGRWLKPPERRAILRAGAGNPLAIELLAQDWIAHGDAAVVLSMPAMQADISATAFDVTAYDRAVDRLVPSLTRRARAALWVATILGPRLNDLTFFQLVDLRDARLIAALAELTACRVLREAGGRLEFSNELMRARLYLLVPSRIRVELHEKVADRLIDGNDKGHDISGLEIAWHCVRARRPQVATPYLMEGARKAIGTGASNEAARALTTALTHLKGRDRDEGLILLAETLQEMADWKGSLEVLAEIERKRKIDPEHAQVRDILVLNGRRGTSFYSVQELKQLAFTIVQRIPSLESPEVASRSALFAARIASDLRSEETSVALKRVLEEMPANVLSPRLKAMQDLALAMSVYYTGEERQSLSILRRCIEGLPDLADTTAASLYAGVAATLSRLGDYFLARQATERALALAIQLDNDLLVSLGYANLALMNFRLGEYLQSRELATKAYELALTQPCAGFQLISAAYFTGMAETFAGHTCEGASAIENLARATSMAEIPWCRQFGYLYLADLHMVRGKIREALRAAREGIEMSIAPLTVACTGPFARWLAILSTRRRYIESGFERLLSLAGGYEALDSLDRAEVDCAMLYMLARTGATDEERETRLRSSLAKLPLPISHQLLRLGILPTSGVTNPVPEAAL